MMRFVFIFVTAAISSYAASTRLTPIALRLKAVDHPNERKMHAEPVPRLGGEGIWLGFTAAVALFLIFQYFVPNEVIGLPLSRELLGLLIGGVILLSSEEKPSELHAQDNPDTSLLC